MVQSLTVEQQSLHDLAIQVGQDHRRSCCRIVEVLIEVETSQFYKRLDCSSLFVYAIKFMGLDEVEAYSSITVARKAREVPRLRQSLREQKITVPKTSRVVSTLTMANAEHLVEFAEKHSTQELNHEVSRIRRKEGLPEKLCSVKVSSGTLAKMKRVRALMNNKTDLNSDWDMALNRALTEYLERHDPVLKAERAMQRKQDRKKQNAMGVADLKRHQFTVKSVV